MTAYLIRRAIQMVGVLLLSAVVSFLLLDLAPGSPTEGLRQQTQTSTRRITEEDIARILASYELDLYAPVRFSRWLIGFPTGPIQLFGKEYFTDFVVGCSATIDAEVVDSAGNFSVRTIGCAR